MLIDNLCFQSRIQYATNKTEIPSCNIFNENCLYPAIVRIYALRMILEASAGQQHMDSQEERSSIILQNS